MSSKKVRIEIAHHIDGLGSVHMEVVGHMEDHTVHLCRRNDWKVFHVKGRAGPLVWVWSKCGEQRLFFLPLHGTDHNLLRLISELEHMGWEPVKTYHGLVIPLVQHPQFSLKVEPAQAPHASHPLHVAPPLLFWYERQDHEDPAVVAKILTA